MRICLYGMKRGRMIFYVILLLRVDVAENPFLCSRHRARSPQNII